MTEINDLFIIISVLLNFHGFQPLGATKFHWYCVTPQLYNGISGTHAILSVGAGIYWIPLENMIQCQLAINLFKYSINI